MTWMSRSETFLTIEKSETEALGPSNTSIMYLFAKIVNDFRPLTTFVKTPILVT